MASLLILSLVVFVGIHKTRSECTETEDYYAALEPQGTITANEGDIVSYMCSTNLLAVFAQWEINDQKYPEFPPTGFTANGLNIQFAVKTTVKIRCFFMVFISGSVINICSNIATVVLMDNLSPHTCTTSIISHVSNTTVEGKSIEPSNSSCSNTFITIGKLRSTSSSLSMMPQNTSYSVISPSGSPHQNLILVSTAAASIVLSLSAFITTAAISIFIYRQHKNKAAKTSNRKCHVYEEVDDPLDDNPVVHVEHNPAYSNITVTSR